MISQLIPRPKGHIRILPDEPKSILTMSKEELNKIDAFQNRNRGFMDDDELHRISGPKGHVVLGRGKV